MPSKPRVLVVEDDLDSYQALSKILKHVGYETVSASSLAAARELIDSADPPPRFIILDLMLPDGNGKELLQHVRDRRIPAKVVVLTASADRELLEEVRQLAPDALFAKPLNVPKLLAWLRQGGSGPSDL